MSCEKLTIAKYSIQFWRVNDGRKIACFIFPIITKCWNLTFIEKKNFLIFSSTTITAVESWIEWKIWEAWNVKSSFLHNEEVFERNSRLFENREDKNYFIFWFMFVMEEKWNRMMNKEWTTFWCSFSLIFLIMILHYIVFHWYQTTREISKQAPNFFRTKENFLRESFHFYFFFILTTLPLDSLMNKKAKNWARFVWKRKYIITFQYTFKLVVRS